MQARRFGADCCALSAAALERDTSWDLVPLPPATYWVLFRESGILCLQRCRNSRTFAGHPVDWPPFMANAWLHELVAAYAGYAVGYALSSA